MDMPIFAVDVGTHRGGPPMLASAPTSNKAAALKEIDMPIFAVDLDAHFGGPLMLASAPTSNKAAALKEIDMPIFAVDLDAHFGGPLMLASAPTSNKAAALKEMNMPTLIYAYVLLFCLPAAAQLKGDVYWHNYNTQKAEHYPYPHLPAGTSYTGSLLYEQRYTSLSGDSIFFTRLNDTLFRFEKRNHFKGSVTCGFYERLIKDSFITLATVSSCYKMYADSTYRDSVILEGFDMAKTGYWIEKDSAGNRASGHYTNDCRSGLWTFVEYPYSDCYNETFSVRQVDYGQPGTADIKKAKALLRGDADTLRGKWYCSGSIRDSVWLLSLGPIGNKTDFVSFEPGYVTHSFTFQNKHYEQIFGTEYHFNSVRFTGCHLAPQYMITKLSGDTIILTRF
jgi:hypothetical protein